MATGAADWVWQHSRAANGPLIVLLAIADELDAKGECVMSHAELARKTRLSNRGVRNGVAELTRLGELKVIEEGGGRGHRTAYAMPGNLAESATFEPETWQDLPPSNVAQSATFSEHQPETPQVRAKSAESATFKISDVLITSTGCKPVEVKETPAKSSRPSRPDVDRLCEHLADRIEANGSKRPAITRKWRDTCRLMIDKDGRTEQQIAAAIDWCQEDEFWRGNVMSMPKLREQYDRLRLDALRKRNGTGRKSTTNDRVQQAIEAGKRLGAMLNGGS